MYHPEDKHAAFYRGKTAITPLFGVRVPMLADPLVEQDKGTGLVMCCTFGDDTDKEWQRIHHLPVRAVIGLDGKFTYDALGAEETRDGIGFYTSTGHKQDNSRLTRENCFDIEQTIACFEQMKGLKPKQAQAKIVELLEISGNMEAKTPIRHAVKCAERSGTPIEIIPTYQWFVRVVDKKEALLAKGRECEWHPEFMRVRLEQWIEGLKEDWCVSRQRFFGVPLPVWYSKRAGEEGKIIVPAADRLPVDPTVDVPAGYEAHEVTGSTDILDTWATSSLSPQINARALHDDRADSRYAKLYPADLRPQAHEIIRTWAFYTIVKSLLHANVAPWSHAMISGWCLAADKTKMSKSKGNVVTPVALIVEKSADVVRYWASTSRLGADTAFSEDLLKIGRKLVTKLWNASAFTAAHLDKLARSPTSPSQDMESGAISEVLDRWILTRLGKTALQATHYFEQLEYSNARSAIEDFFWKDFATIILSLSNVALTRSLPKAPHPLEKTNSKARF